MAYKINQIQPYYRGAQHMVGTDTFEPQRTNNFEVRFEGLDELISSTGTMPYKNCGKAITLSVSSVGNLNQSIDALPVSYGNNAIKFAGKPTLNSISISVNDFIGLNTERILEAWSALVYNKNTQNIGRATAYKRRGYLIEYSPDYEICKIWQLEGCWPGSIDYGGYAQDGGNMRQISFDLHIDFAYALDNETVDTDYVYNDKAGNALKN